MQRVLTACLLVFLAASPLGADEGIASSVLNGGEEKAPVADAGQPGLWGSRPLPLPDSGNALESIVFSVAGQAVSLKNGGVLALHPDSPFRVLSMQSDAWFDFNLQAELAGMPGVDLMGKPHTLAGLLGDNIYIREFVDVLVLRKDQVIGGVRIMVRLLPIDWLRQAEKASDLGDKMYYLYKAYELSPDDRLLALNLVDGLRALGRLEQALKILDEYPNLDEDQAALKHQGYVYLALGRMDEALEAFNKVRALKADDMDTLLAISEIYEAGERWDEAAEIIKQLIASHTPSIIENDAPDESEANESAPGDADKSIAAGPIPDPLLATMWLRLARDLAHVEGKMEESLFAYEKYIHMGNPDHLLWLEIAQFSRRAGHREREIKARRMALAAAPDNPDMIMQLQTALQHYEQYGEAALVLSEGVEKLPREDMLWLEMFKLYRATEDSPSLIKSYENYLKLRPGQADIYYNLALVLEKENNYSAAAEAMAQALGLKPRDEDYLLGLLKLNCRLERMDEALKLAARLLEENEQSLSVWQELYTLLGKQKPAELAALLDKALDTARPLPKLYEMRALLALNQKNANDAASVLAKAAELFPTDPRIAYLLAGIYEGMNQDDRALPLYEKIMSINPAYEDVEKRYLQLKIRLLEE